MSVRCFLGEQVGLGDQSRGSSHPGGRRTCKEEITGEIP